jgi:hypothetical protein
MWILCFAHCKQKEEQREKWSTTSHHIPTVEFCSAKKLVTLFFSVFFFLEYPDITFQASNFAQQKLATRFFFPWKLVGRYPSEIICFVGTGASAILYFCPITNRRQRHNNTHLTDSSTRRAFYIFTIITDGEHSKVILKIVPTDLPLLCEDLFTFTLFADVARHDRTPRRQPHATQAPSLEIQVMPMSTAPIHH